MNPVLKRTLTGLTIGLVVVAAALYAPPVSFVWVFGSLVILAVVEFATLLNIKLPMFSLRGFPLLCLGALVIACGLWAMPMIASRYDNLMCGAFRRGNVMLLYVIMIVKFSDVGGFAFGLTSARLMKGGNHKMCPSISPGKSWEGMAGSIFASCLVSCCFMGATGFGLGKSAAIGVMAAVIGTAGDLVESKFKRWVGVKDSSTMKITNGMGGLLDMFDSLIFAPAAIYAFL